VLSQLQNHLHSGNEAPHPYIYNIHTCEPARTGSCPLKPRLQKKTLNPSSQQCYGQIRMRFISNAFLNFGEGQDGPRCRLTPFRRCTPSCLIQRWGLECRIAVANELAAGVASSAQDAKNGNPGFKPIHVPDLGAVPGDCELLHALSDGHDAKSQLLCWSRSRSD
jgi:hypothetical protein